MSAFEQRVEVRSVGRGVAVMKGLEVECALMC